MSLRGSRKSRTLLLALLAGVVALVGLSILVSRGPDAKPEGAASDLTVGRKAWGDAGCGGCHVLERAGSTGTSGPNLDQTQLSVEQVGRIVSDGAGVMPPFRDQLSPSRIRAVAKYVVEPAGS
jgi:mono/diheme cytochrome c family protein